MLDHSILSLEHVSVPKMKTSIVISLLALVAPICAVPMEALEPRYISFPESVTSSPKSHSVGRPIPTTLSYHHGTHKTGGFHPYGPTGRPNPTGTRPLGTGHHSIHPHPTGGHHGYKGQGPEGTGGPRYIHSPLLAKITTYTTTGPKPSPYPQEHFSLKGGGRLAQLACYSPTPFTCQLHFIVRSWSSLAAIDLALFLCRLLDVRDSCGSIIYQWSSRISRQPCTQI